MRLQGNPAAPNDRVDPPGEGTAPCQRFFDDVSTLVSFTIYLGQVTARGGSTQPDAAEIFRSLGAFAPLIHETVLTRAVDAFEIYLRDLFALIFTTRPETLRSNEQIKVGDVLQQTSMDDVVKFLAERRVNRLAYAGLRDVADELEASLNLRLFDAEDQLRRAIEIVEARNLIVHNRGIVNAQYRRRVGADRQLGDRLDLDTTFVFGSIEFLARACADIDTRAVEKFGLPIEKTARLPEDVVLALADPRRLLRELRDPEVGQTTQ